MSGKVLIRDYWGDGLGYRWEPLHLTLSHCRCGREGVINHKTEHEGVVAVVLSVDKEEPTAAMVDEGDPDPIATLRRAAAVLARAADELEAMTKAVK